MIKECNLNFVCQIIADEIDNNSEILNILGDDFTDNISFYGNDEGQGFENSQENQFEGQEKPVTGDRRTDSKDQRSKEEVDNLFIDYGYESQIDEGSVTSSDAESEELSRSKEATREILQEINSLPLSRVEGLNMGQNQAIHFDKRKII